MKKCFVVVLMLFVTMSVFADGGNEYYQVNSILESGLKGKEAMVADLASNLSPVERTMLYESNKKSTLLPFGLNLLLGAGVGSYVQGDTVGGTVSLCGELGSGAIMLAGYFMVFSDAMNATASNTTMTEVNPTASALMVAGSIGLLAFRIYDLIRPFTYAKSYNKNLAAALNSGAPSVAVLPIVQQDGNVGMTMVASIQF